MNTAIGKNIKRKDALLKVTGKAEYTDDILGKGLLEVRLLTSTLAHARIKSIDTSKAKEIKGVKAVLTGDDCNILFGPLLQDRPALAKNVVRYAGEPIALAVAADKAACEKALRAIDVEFERLPAVLTPLKALDDNAPLVHEKSNSYKKVLTDIYPRQGTNIASSYRMEKGNINSAFDKCSFIAEQNFFLPPSGHIAMEVRTARAEINSNGDVTIISSSQAPYSIRKQISEAFLIPSGKIHVKVPFVGGGFGGKAPVTLEILAVLASMSVSGRAVRVTIEREDDMAALPCRMGLEAAIKIGADSSGFIQAADLKFYLDCGAYTDISPYMTKAIAMDCTGPYHVENLSCDAFCVYTNHTYVTSYRGFSHDSITFCIERVLDILAKKCFIDPLEFRLKNAIRPQSLTPSKVKCTNSLTGDLRECIKKMKELSQWGNGKPIYVNENTVKAKGIACFWKTENPPTDAISGSLITFNPDGSLNLNTGVVEMGSNGQTHLAQILAEKLKIDTSQVHIIPSVDTRLMPEHWKTVASLTEYMAGHAVVRAADDILEQLRINGSQALKCHKDEIVVSHGRVFSKKNPENFIEFKDIVQGYKSENDESLGEPVIGSGGYMLKGLTLLDTNTGEGKTGPQWTVGVQVVEVEADLKTFRYRLLNASTVIDIGKLINPNSTRASLTGAMAMGLSLASREGFIYNKDGIVKAPNLRSYKLLHIGQEPNYKVDFVETPDETAPFGVRSYSEHGLIGMPAALGNALSLAFNKEFLTLPLTPEVLWSTRAEDSV
ncbi:MAG TPA: xanthine dehydrogenase family protein molybdopterin-binding subunit [Oscillospiraceae bacterium]|nr:xanthine dehydrogenase family protein molybdopterin-binding subunit [Oscillospiraceae bacterium]